MTSKHSKGMLTIALGSDHAGLALKEQLQTWIRGNQLGTVQDFGCCSDQACDYPDFAHPVAEAVQKGEIDFGILLCGSANGMAITANKHKGVRAAICWSEDTAKLARAHNNANLLCLPARFLREEEAKKITQLFLQTAFEGGRHERRVSKIDLQ